QREKIGLVFCDLHMPVMDGLTLLQELRSMKRPMKTIMMSTAANLPTIRACMNGGAFDFLSKPLDFDDLKISLTKAIEELLFLQQAKANEKALQKIEAENAQLQSLDRFKSRFFTNIAHEFRTPLTVIQGMAEQIESKPASWSLRGSKLIQRNARQLLELVGQLLELRKLEKGRLKLHLVQLDLIPWLGYVAESFQSLAIQQGLAFHYQSALESCYLDVDPDRLGMVIGNLLSNAIKYTEAGGEIFLQARQKHEELIVSVQDNGLGIPSTFLPRVFDRFFRLDESNPHGNSATHSSGVGLSFCKELVELMGGKIKVESKEEVGTTFWVHLPIRQKAPIQDDLYPDLPQIPLPPEETVHLEGEAEEQELPHILLVEDHNDVRTYLQSLLTDQYQLLVAKDGKEGWKMARKKVPDLIISDVMMPKMDGYQLCEKVKAHPLTLHVPVILLTAKASQQSKKTAYTLGADAYLPKPFDREELLIRVQSLLETRQVLQKQYQAMVQEGEAEIPIEDPLLEGIRNLVEQHLDDPEFRVPELSREMGYSRSQLHRKVKALTGNTITHFIQQIRLQKGDELLRSSSLSISEIAYSTGHSAPNYFAKLYRAKYGISPKKRRKNLA
ncbi:MAG: response regulator, partial [Bacteroidota bacterium]